MTGPEISPASGSACSSAPGTVDPCAVFAAIDRIGDQFEFLADVCLEDQPFEADPRFPLD